MQKDKLMNLFQLVSKQMRQRALSTWLTLLSVLLGVSLAVAIMILRREGQNLFAQTDYGFDIILGPSKGSPLQLTLNTVYHMDVSPGVIPYAIYQDVARKGPPPPGHPDYRPYVRQAVPFMVGDSFQGRRIVGTSPRMFGFDDEGQPVTGEKWQYRQGKSFELAQGRVFAARKFEAVIGSDVADKLHLHLYDDKLSPEENEKNGGAFRATHGMPSPNETPDIHKPRWRIVGILKPTRTANDRVLFIPFVSLYAIAEHEEGLIDQALMKANIDPSRIPPDRLDDVLSRLGIDPNKVPETVKKKFKMKSAATAPAAQTPQDVGELMQSATVQPAPEKKEAAGEDPDAYHLDEHGDIVPDLPQDEWELSAVLVQSRGGFQAQQIMYNFKVIDDRATAVNPATTMREFFRTFLSGSTEILLLIAAFVSVVAAASIMTTIYNSVSARLREIAILRALGATRTKILTLICTEAVIVGLLGGLLGFIVGHLLSAAGSAYLDATMGEGINWLGVGPEEWVYLALVVVMAFLAGLVPAMKAYRTPVATNLVAT
jgi:putative ABC transport system permease protein